MERTASYIQEAISSLILHDELKDPRISKFVQVNRVEVSSDTASAKVYISTFEDEAALHRSVEGLKTAAGFIQKRIAKYLHTRNTPRLYFKADTSIRDSIQVNSLIDHLNEDDQSVPDSNNNET
jgi:ribosome-binding factor A